MRLSPTPLTVVAITAIGGAAAGRDARTTGRDRPSPGTGATLGAELAAKAPADGYTLLVAAAPHVINPARYKQVKYDALRNFAPFTMAIAFPYALTMYPDLAPPADRLRSRWRARGRVIGRGGAIIRSLQREMAVADAAKAGSAPMRSTRSRRMPRW